MTIDAFDLQIRQRRGAAVNLRRALNVDAELIVAQAGRNIRVGLGVNVGIYPYRNRRGDIHGCGNSVQAL